MWWEAAVNPVNATEIADGLIFDNTMSERLLTQLSKVMQARVHLLRHVLGALELQALGRTETTFAMSSGIEVANDKLDPIKVLIE